MTDRDTGRDGRRPVPDGLFEAHPDPVVYFTDRKDDVYTETVNPAFENTFGVSAADVVGTHLDEAATPGDFDPADRLSGGASVDEVVVCQTAADTATFRVRSVERSGDRLEGYLVYTRPTPVTPMDAEGDRVEELARVVSHELRNPLDSIRTRVETAHTTGELDHLETALRNVDRMARILTDLTTLAREGRLIDDRTAVDLTATVEETWRTIDTAGARLELAGDLGTVSADAGALEHLLENLFRNSVEHGSTGSRTQSDDSVEHGTSTDRDRDDDRDGTREGDTTTADGPDEGGRVTVTVGPIEREGTTNGAGFFVADDGPGIPEDDRERVFETGFTTERGGTGLGLRIVERVAQAHGWSVSVDDSDDGGARFEITGIDRRD